MSSEEELHTFELLLNLVEDEFDYEAAQRATPDEARMKLRLIKHYIRASLGDERINEKVRAFLLLFGIDPAHPYSVVGGFEFMRKILKGMHKCNGKKCVLKLKKRQELRRKTLMKKEAQSKAKKSGKMKKKDLKVSKESVSKKSAPKARSTKANAKKETAKKKVGKGPKKVRKAKAAEPTLQAESVSSSDGGGWEVPLHYI